jgi:hypothetical protein
MSNQENAAPDGGSMSARLLKVRLGLIAFLWLGMMATFAYDGLIDTNLTLRGPISGSMRAVLFAVFLIESFAFLEACVARLKGHRRRWPLRILLLESLLNFAILTAMYGFPMY